MGRAQSWARNTTEISGKEEGEKKKHKRSGERRDGGDATGRGGKGRRRSASVVPGPGRRRDVAEASGRPPSPIPTCFLLLLLHGRLVLPAPPTPPSPQRGTPGFLPPLAHSVQRLVSLLFPTNHPYGLRICAVLCCAVLPGTSCSQSSSCQALHVPGCKFVCSPVPNTGKLALPSAAAAVPGPRVSSGFTAAISSVSREVMVAIPRSPLLLLS